MSHQLCMILDFGGQYNQLIARRVRECSVYCEVFSYKTPIEKIKELNPAGIIFTGGPNSVYAENSPKISKEIFELGIPILGICYGYQLMAHTLGGKVANAIIPEYGKTSTSYDTSTMLFESLSESNVSWMSHSDYITELPDGFVATASTTSCTLAAMVCSFTLRLTILLMA